MFIRYYFDGVSGYFLFVLESFLNIFSKVGNFSSFKLLFMLLFLGGLFGNGGMVGFVVLI